jgi:hypothetical protein
MTQMVAQTAIAADNVTVDILIETVTALNRIHDHP